MPWRKYELFAPLSHPLVCQPWRNVNGAIKWELFSTAGKTWVDFTRPAENNSFSTQGSPSSAASLVSPPVRNKPDKQIKSFQPTLITTFPTKYGGAEVLMSIIKAPTVRHWTSTCPHPKTAHVTSTVQIRRCISEDTFLQSRFSKDLAVVLLSFSPYPFSSFLSPV